MSTKRSRHGQGDESLVVISFGVDSDMDLGSVFHIIQRWHRFFIFTIYYHSPGRATAAALADGTFYTISLTTGDNATALADCLHSLCALVVECFRIVEVYSRRLQRMFLIYYFIIISIYQRQHRVSAHTHL